MTLIRSNPHLYEINTRIWLKELSAKYNKNLTLGTIPEDEWLHFKKMGFDYVWLMGIWELSPQAKQIAQTIEVMLHEYDGALSDCTKEDIIGSPYAVYRYEPNPELGTWEDIDLVRELLHQNNMGLVLDFVPNHMAIDTPWIDSNPDYFIQAYFQAEKISKETYFLVKEGKEKIYFAHGRDPFFPAWIDTAQLNYFNPKLRKALIFTLQKIANHCDGVRCDMAMLVLNEIHQSIWGANLQALGYKYPKDEFWEVAIQEVKQEHPEFMFMAEVYWEKEQHLRQLGFDYMYDKTLYDHLLHKNPHSLHQYLQISIEEHKHLVRFLENHDEPRAISSMGQDKSLAAATLVATLPGLRFYHEGQLEGWTIKLPVQLGRRELEKTNTKVLHYYEKLLNISNLDIFHSENWQMVFAEPLDSGNISNLNLIAYQWQQASERIVVVVNLSSYPSQGYIKLPDFSCSRNQCSIEDLLHDKVYENETTIILQQGIFIDLAPFQAHIFRIKHE